MAAPKSRSPQYPQIDFVRAITAARKIYKSEQTHAAAPEVIAQVLGYSGLSGASKPVLAALKYYGLLEPAGDGFRISGDAISIFELPKESPERAAALRRCLSKPSLFGTLSTHFNGGIPSDANLRHWLITNGFSGVAAGQIVKVYRANLEFQRSEAFEAAEPVDAAQHSSLNTDTSAEQSAEPAEPPVSAPTHTHIPAKAAPSEHVLRFKIARDAVANVQITGMVTQEGIKRLIALLNLTCEAFPAS